MKIIQIDKKDWSAGLKKMREAYRLIGPVRDGDYHLFSELADGAEPDFAFGNTRLSVKEIISPTSMLLSDGATIQLLGVKIKPSQKENALEFIKQKLHKQRVFLKHDNNFPKPETNGKPHPCYLYLRNRTFVNAHLIKSGLVRVDTRSSYRMKKRYLSFVPQEVR